jgi:DNA topoisomerase IB
LREYEVFKYLDDEGEIRDVKSLNTRDIARVSYISPRVIDHYLEGSVVAYHGELIEEIVAEQEGLTEGEAALLQLLNKKLGRELRKAA